MSARPAPTTLAALLEHPGLWRGEESARTAAAAPSGFPALDAWLPGGGWPEGALTELFVAAAGVGELSLLMPLCARLTRAGRRVVFVSPPHIPYAPGLAAAGLDLSRLLLVEAAAGKDRLWALEQALKSQQCGAALAWLPRVEASSLRRLQLACEQGTGSGFLFLPEEASRNASTAALRLRLAAGADGGLDVHVLKRRGGTVPRPIRIARVRSAA
jgi:cell division inhibitor SulA/protein ImuA